MQGLGREVNDFLYEGQFCDGVYHGYGRYINDLGTFWGFYDKGIRHGKGTFVGYDGKVQAGYYYKGSLFKFLSLDGKK